MEATGRLLDEERDTMAAPAGQLRPAAMLPGTMGPDVINGTDAADRIDALGGDDTVNGRGGDDVISGGDGNDTLRGGAGVDIIGGGPGNDTIDGGSGDDTLNGGADDDLLRGKLGNDELSGGSGDDELRGGGLDDTLSGDEGDDTLLGGGGTDVLRGKLGDDVLEGGTGNDDLRGGAGNDTLSGEFGDDLLDGGSGDDTLIGGQGRDELRGGGGADVLDGKGSLDILIGGGGADVFTFTTRDGTGDRVLDFAQGQDRLDISALLPNFQPGDDLDLFVQLEVTANGTVVSIDPSGSGTNFELLAGLEGVSINAFTPEELGLGGSLPGARTVVSTNVNGEIANGTAFAPSLSLDGRFLSFASAADNLIDADTNAAFDIFRKDLSTGEVELVTQIQGPGSGVQQANGNSFFSSISGAGDVVAFDSTAGNLAAGETGQSNVFVNTVGTAAPDLVSIVGNRFANDPSISDDGTLVAFNATATGRAETSNPAPLDTIIPRVFVRDLSDGSLVEVSSDSSGRFADGTSGSPDIAADGNFVAFQSAAGNLLGTDANPGYDIYVKSLIDGSVQIASTTSGGLQGFGSSINSTISGDGRFVAFQSVARLVAEDFGNTNDIYLKDLQSGDLTLVTLNANGIKGNGASFTPSISDDGRFIAFRSAADNLVADDANGRPDIFVFDTQGGQFARIALTSDASGANPDLVGPTISGDGGLVAFVDQVAVSGTGSLTAGQVVVAPVGGFGAAALAAADVLSNDLAPINGPAAGHAIAPASNAGVTAAAQSVQAIQSASALATDLGTLVVQPDAV